MLFISHYFKFPFPSYPPYNILCPSTFPSLPLPSLPLPSYIYPNPSTSLGAVNIYHKSLAKLLANGCYDNHSLAEIISKPNSCLCHFDFQVANNKTTIYSVKYLQGYIILNPALSLYLPLSSVHLH